MPRSLHRILVPCLLLALAWTGVVRGGEPVSETQAMPSENASQLNQTARGLAGLSADGSWESTSQWKSYQGWLNDRWSYLNRVRLSAMRSWGGSALGGIRSDTSTVFYPFSGPDFLYADTLFPDSKVLLMAGLEPIGSMPDLNKLKEDGRLGAYLNQVQTSMATILSASFFKTKDMKNDFGNDLVDGILPALAVFIARQGHDIEGIHYVSLGADGSLKVRESKAGANGVQITYGGGRVVLYFSIDLGNDGLRSNPGYTKLMGKLAPGITYLKAASYLLYEDYFSLMRNAILGDSLAVVEDDSGIPFRYFKSSEWDVVPYGNYTGPIALFHEHYQQDLDDYYKKTSHSPLPFGSGYKFVSSVSSLLVAKKK